MYITDREAMPAAQPPESDAAQVPVADQQSIPSTGHADLDRSLDPEPAAWGLAAGPEVVGPGVDATAAAQGSPTGPAAECQPVLPPLPDHAQQWQAPEGEGATHETAPASGQRLPSDIAGPSTSPSSPPDAGRTAAIYVDADNQLPACAEPLLVLCRGDLAITRVEIVIAGNNAGRQLDLWVERLHAVDPAAEVEPLQVPARKEAADLALVMALGANLQRHRTAGDLILIVSRDELLVGAAERARALGCCCLVAYSSGAPVRPHAMQLPTLILPLPDKGATAAAPPLVAATSDKQDSIPVKPAAGQDTRAILTGVRKALEEHPKGGYAAGPLGYVLAQMGLDAKARARFLTQTDGVRVVGSGPDKRYLLP